MCVIVAGASVSGISSFKCVGRSLYSDNLYGKKLESAMEEVSVSHIVHRAMSMTCTSAEDSRTGHVLI